MNDGIVVAYHAKQIVIGEEGKVWGSRAENILAEYKFRVVNTQLT